MPTNHRARLAGIRRFDQLVAYLRDEMGWPIAQDSFDDADDLFYDFTPEELGIDTKNAAKIQEIRRLRPLSTHQPWGIFFVKFEPKRLPVIALRRILSQVALKKRASANSAERAVWSADDLLFISNYGEGENRQITFAHFSQNEAKKDLPILKVLGWDNLNTPLHLDHVAETLIEHLAWPDDEDNENEWRRQWRSAFTEGHREIITTSKRLSIELAKLARNIRDRINTVLAIETENGPVSKLMAAFKEVLIHDLDEDGFADMYAQTIAYGLLTARITNPTGVTADEVVTAMPVTNPFLKELMETFIDVGGRKGKMGSSAGLDFDELGVGDVVELLDAANMEAVVRDFGDKNPQEDPVIHFYELFLKEYDAKKRMQRGVFYTPRPVVSFIVRSVDELLRTEFGLENGLADTTTWQEMSARIDDLEIPEGTAPDQAFVQILDPATGTGTFLVEVIGLIHKTMTEKWQAEDHKKKKIEKLWNDYVPQHLLPRLHGYELMMAPYAIAHMKIGLKLYETGYKFKSNERARVYLTNSLEPSQDFSDTLAFAIPALAHEAEAVNAIKRDSRFTVVIGNPPYSGLSSNMNPWIDGLLKGRLPDGTQTASFYHVDGKSLGERKLWLQDDYVKFIRLSQWLIDSSGCGVLGYITNHGYLDNPTFRGMRWSLMRSFDAIHVLDLHGNLKKKEATPDGHKDVNVFDIQQGVATGLFIKRRYTRKAIDLSSVHHCSYWGDRKTKYACLLANTTCSIDWQKVDRAKPFYLFEPFDLSEVGDYYNWPMITEVMPINGVGIVTARDKLTIDFERDGMWKRIQDFAKLEREDARSKYQLGKDVQSWTVAQAQKDVRASGPTDTLLYSILYRPFDQRWTYYTGKSGGFICRPSPSLMPHLLERENLALITCRQQARVGDEWSQVGVTNTILESCAISNITREINYAFPLYLYPGIGNQAQDMFEQEVPIDSKRRPNLNAMFIATIEKKTNLAFVDDRCGDLATNFGPEDVLGYIYATLHSPEYRRRFDSSLKLDFPRVPWPASMQFFRELVGLGSDLISLHLLRTPSLNALQPKYEGPADPQVEKVSYSEETVWIDKPKTRGFLGVPEEVWNFHIGGYQVCEKWLKDRQAKGGKNPHPGRVLTDEDIDYYQKIVVALNETIRIMAKIDDLIETHGGWPEAFAVSKESVSLPKVAEESHDYDT